MALASSGVWEVDRALGSDSNGGMFDPVSGVPGTDYTQGAGYFTNSYTDMVIDAVTNTSITSAARPFVAADVGNTIRVSAGTGWTVQVLQIMSVSGVTATVDKSAGTLGSTGGTGVLGGALLTVGPLGHASRGIQPGNSVWIKYNASPYSITTTTANVSGGLLASANSGTETLPFEIRGYDVVRGDETTNRPTLQAGVNMGHNVMMDMGGDWTVTNIIFDGNRASFTDARGLGSANYGIVRRCKFMGHGSSFGPTGINDGAFIDCEFVDNSGAMQLQGPSPAFYYCNFHDNAANPMTVNSSTDLIVHGCIFDSNAGAGIVFQNSSSCGGRISDCVFYNNTGAGIDITSVPDYISIMNCIFESNTTYGVKTNAAVKQAQLHGNAFYNNTTAKYVTAQILARNTTQEIIPTASVFTNAASGDFSLNSNAAGGALLTDAGYPTTLPPGTTTTKGNVGAAGPGARGGGAAPMLGA